jgi:omega-hydroxy-beta-dihydromenaquinone-9 sulfotransferase
MGLKRDALTLLARALPSFWANKLKNPVFVIGCARSGTTLLTDLLSLHLDVLDFSEANDIWDPTGYPWWRSRRETPPIWADPEAFTERWWRDTRPRSQEISAIFGALQWLSRKPYFLNKTPLNTFRLPHLLEMFPDARFIHIIRDGRATVASYALKESRKIEAGKGVYEDSGLGTSFDALVLRLALFWKENLEEVARRNQELHLCERNKLLEVTYEELCADKALVLERVCRFIGLDPNRFSAKVWQMDVKNQNHKWQVQLDPAVLQQMLSVIGTTLDERGYA